MVDMVKEALDVRFDYIAHLLSLYRAPQRVQSFVTRTHRPIPIRKIQEISLINLLQHPCHCPLYHLVLYTRNAKGSLLVASSFGYVAPPDWFGSITHPPQPLG